jgi:hypothetical protein
MITVAHLRDRSRPQIMSQPGGAMTTSNTHQSRPPGHASESGVITRAFATPVVRIAYPFGQEFNGPLAELVMGRLSAVDNKFSYKSETAADMTSWQEPLIDNLTGWVLTMARRFVETITGLPLDDAYAEADAQDRETFNSTVDGASRRRVVSVVPTRSWASVYRRGDHHEAHFHPNTALAAIYYVESPGPCELDLLDPRPNVDYFDPGITFAEEGRTLRLRCEPGDLVLLPGWLKHSVPMFTGDSVRISLSWNLRYLSRPAAPDGR